MGGDDSHAAEPRAEEPDITFLPEVIGIEAKRRRYRKPRYRAQGSAVEEVREAVEITIETSAPFPQRALGPVLLVGRVELSESERVGPNRYRFYAYDYDRLKEGSAIRIGWFSQPRPRRQTGFRFALGGRRRGTEFTR